MPIKQEHIADFEEGKTYHVFSRTNNGEALFLDTNNRNHFIAGFKEYIAPFVRTLAWNLQNSHFHFVIQVKPRQAIIKYLTTLPDKTTRRMYRLYINERTSAARLISFQWRRFLISYAMHYNRVHSRHGNLFHRVFKRICLKSDMEIRKAVLYVKGNNCKHDPLRSWRNHNWSSFQLPDRITIPIHQIELYIGPRKNWGFELDAFWEDYFRNGVPEINSFSFAPG